MVDDESMRRNRNATPQFIGALTEMVWTQIGERNRHRNPPASARNPAAHSCSDQTSPCIENVALDLETFSRHAGRSTVTTDDVLLLARRNQDLHDIIKDCVDQLNAARAKGKSRR